MLHLVGLQFHRWRVFHNVVIATLWVNYYSYLPGVSRLRLGWDLTRLAGAPWAIGKPPAPEARWREKIQRRKSLALSHEESGSILVRLNGSPADNESSFEIAAGVPGDLD